MAQRMGRRRSLIRIYARNANRAVDDTFLSSNENLVIRIIYVGI